jgi:hypothetical protein
MYLARDVTGLSLVRIAREFRRDHSTVLHAIRRVEASLEPGSDLHIALDKSRTLLGGDSERPRGSSTSDPSLHTTSPPTNPG